MMTTNATTCLATSASFSTVLAMAAKGPETVAAMPDDTINATATLNKVDRQC